MKRYLAHADIYLANHRFTFFIQHRLDWQILRIEQGVIFGLPVVRIDRLLKVPFAIEQTDAGKADSQVVGRFCVVTRKNSKSTSGNRKVFVKPNSAEK